ncbi:hypothetical protein EV00_0143 [Prochlorococcus marinus str. MIT 9322]|nr:hypothetical protein EV00_0143 [Prochlorococcus marinus str. MIT 9322]
MFLWFWFQTFVEWICLFCKLILFSIISCSQDKINKKFIEIKFAHDRDE